MNRTLIKEITSQDGETILLKGYTERVRRFHDFTFIHLRDRTGTCQVVLPHEIYGGKIRQEDMLKIRGIVKRQRSSRYRGIEVVADNIGFINRGVAGSLIKAESGEKVKLETLLENRGKSLRIEDVRGIFELRSKLTEFISNYMRREGFLEVHSPTLIGSAMDGGSELFDLDFFGKRAALSQSPQLYHQMLLCSIERVFEISHCFRAQKYDTSRHVNEFITLDAEMGFIDGHEDVIDYVGKLVGKSVKEITGENGQFITIPYDEAIRMVGKEFGEKIGKDEKEMLGRIVREKTDSNLIILRDLPDKFAQFYFTKGSTPGTRNCFRVLYRGSEVGAGGERIHNYEELIEGMKQGGLDLNQFTHYLDSFRSGIPPHGGFCIGLDRLTTKMCKLDNIQKAILFPRNQKRISP